MPAINSYEMIQGSKLENTVQISNANPFFVIPGTNGMIPVDLSMLSKHLLFLGGIGMGKTNGINLVVRNIRNTMTDNDIMVIFDPKGDYYETFYREGDIVISNDERCTDFWNIFEEINIDDRKEVNIMEIANFFFKEKIEHSSNPFFPGAAKDVFASLLTYIVRKNIPQVMNNRALRRNIDTKNSKDYTQFFSQYDDMKGVCAYIADDAKGQTQGVISEFQQTVREIFIGNFRKKGDFSIRKAVRNKGNKAIFIEYDLSLGKTLAPIYGLLMDLAIKESLCRKSDEGNVYFVMDEFRLMTPLEHMDNGINFGRSLGAKFILGLQNVEQIYDVYGEFAGRSILSGCSTLIAFYVNDAASREIIKERGGENLKKLTFSSSVASKGIYEQVMNGHCIEDWDIGQLGVGEAIVQYSNCSPFVFKFRKFE